MSYVVVSSTARADLDGLFDDLAHNSLNAAEILLDHLGKLAREHAQSTFLGTPCPELGHVLRSFTVAKSVVFYLADVDGIQLVRILHSARDIPRATFEAFAID